MTLGSKGKNPLPEIKIPNVIHLEEFLIMKKIIEEVAKEIDVENKIKYKIRTMVEFPRAALIADALAKESEFMSFGTNDLTQTTLGLSRDDAGKFVHSYLVKGIFKKDPFQTIDKEGVGKLISLAVEKARSVKPEIKIGICGEHGGDAASIEFCHEIRLSNISCSPYRVPIAILVAAQSAIKRRNHLKIP